MRVNSVNLPEIKRMKRKERGETRFPLSFLSSKQGFATMAPSTRDAVELADELQGRREPCPLKHHCAEFVRDSHAPKLRALALILC